MKQTLQQHFKHHILRNHFLHIALGVLFGIAMVIRLLSSSAQVTDPFFPFNSFIAKHNNTSSLYFQYGGNSFTGVVAWSGWMELSTPERISVSGTSLTGIVCNKQIEGMYYNPVRGAKLWPLDQNTLQQLKNLDSSYQGMLMNGGLYTDCVGSGIQSNYVIGQVAVNYAGSRYDILAGLSYDLIGNVLNSSQATLGGTLTFQNNRFQGKLFDVYAGGIADVSNQTLPSHMAFGGFTGAVFFPGISSVLNAEPKKLYQSNGFNVVGLTGRTQATITSGALLYVNGSLVGTSAMINNNEEIKIEMFASENYGDIVTSTITVGSLTGLFSVTTKSRLPDMCILTKEDKAKVQATFSGLLIQYNSTAKLTTLLLTMKSMINDMQDFNYDCNVAYLKTLIEDYLGDIEAGTTNSHTAPNCKKYTIIYSNTGDKVGYSSSNLRTKQYFANRLSLIKFIDSKNPGDCNVVNYDNLDDGYMEIDDDKYIAPNGKVYDIRETSAGKYTSSTFSKSREFSSRESLLTFIDNNNPGFEVWDHKVDTSRNPVTYVAANNKEYKIYKTDKGFMSYKLVKVQYFGTKEEIIDYINRNNKR